MGLNKAVTGRLVNGRGWGMPGIRVKVYDEDLIGDDFLGETVTGGSGEFYVSYDPRRYKDWPLSETEPDIRLEFRKPALTYWDPESESHKTLSEQSVAFHSEAWDDVKAEVLYVGNITSAKNTAVEGYFIDLAGEPLPGVEVIVYENDLFDQDVLGVAYSDASGFFRVDYFPSSYSDSGLESEPDIVVKAWSDSASYVSPEFSDVRSQTKDLGVIRMNEPPKNTAVNGRVVWADSGRPVAGHPVVLYQVKYSGHPSSSYLDELGRARTDAGGSFSFSLAPAVRRKIVVHVLDQSEAEVLKAVSCEERIGLPKVYQVTPDISLNWAEANGWFPRPGATTGNSVDLYLDNEEAWREFVSSLNRVADMPTGSGLHFLQTWLNPQLRLTFDPSGQPNAILSDAVTSIGFQRQISLRGAFGSPDSERLFRKHLGVGADRTACCDAMHGKAIVLTSPEPACVGLEAFVGGSAMLQAYWDTVAHNPSESASAFTDQRRAGVGEAGEFTDQAFSMNQVAVGSKPVHDVILRVKGPCVGGVETLIQDVWRHTKGYSFGKATNGPDAGDRTVEIALTEPHGTSSSLEPTGLWKSYEDAIRRAERLVYLELPRFASSDLFNLLMKTLSDTSRRVAVVLLLTQEPDEGAATQNQMIDELNRCCGAVEDAGFRAFSLWRLGDPPAGTTSHVLQRCYIASRVAIVDNRWFCAGGDADHYSLFGDAAGSHFELGVCVYDALEQPRGHVDVLRSRLWEEHFRRPVPYTQVQSLGSALWHSEAQANLSALRSGNVAGFRRILPYVTQNVSGAARQLEAMGLTAAQIARYLVVD